MRLAGHGTIVRMESNSQFDPRSMADTSTGFDSATLTGLLYAGASQGFLRVLTRTFAGPQEWRTAQMLPGEDPCWKAAPPRDPACAAFIAGKPDYPWVLETFRHHPAILYVQGAADVGSLGAMVCVAGSPVVNVFGRLIVDMVVDELASLGAALVCGTQSGVQEYAARLALSKGVPTVLVASCGSGMQDERTTLLCRDVVDAGGSVLSVFAENVGTNAYTLQAASHLLAMFAYPLIVAQANVPSPATALAAQALRFRSPLMVPLPRHGFRADPCSRGLLALADIQHTRLLGWKDDLLLRRGVNGFANALPETGDELRLMLRALWWLRPRSATCVARRFTVMSKVTT